MLRQPPNPCVPINTKRTFASLRTRMTFLGLTMVAPGRYISRKKPVRAVLVVKARWCFAAATIRPSLLQRLRPADDLGDLLGNLRLPGAVVLAREVFDDLAGVFG